jgi:GH25 family lysozyme M1 (1,4-beta-N-acetylmuramidase)
MRLCEIGTGTLATRVKWRSRAAGAAAAAAAVVAGSVMSAHAGSAIPARLAAVQHPSVAAEAAVADRRLAVNLRQPHAGRPEAITHPAADTLGSTVKMATAAPGFRPAATTTAPMGVDVASYQGDVNWTSVVAGGATFAYAKATEGTYYYDSTYFPQQYNGSYAAGMIRGAYHFAVPDNSTGAAQADYFIANGGGWSADGQTLPGMLDFEPNPYGAECYGLTPSQLVGWVVSFDTEYQLLTGRYPLLYTNATFWDTCTGGASAASVDPLDVAAWGYSPSPLPGGWSSYAIWQYTDSNTMGYDGDTFNGSYAALQAFAGGGQAPSTAAAGGLAAVAPARLLDTRSGVGAPGPVPSEGTVAVQVDGRGGVPASGVGAVVLNVTVTRPAAAGFLTVFPDGSPRPGTSNLNFAPGETVPNLVVVPVGSDGKVDVYNEAPGSVQVIADVAGWFASGSPAAGGLAAVSPARLLDTRSGVGASGPVRSGRTVVLQVDGRGGVPASGVGAVALNVTVTRPAAAGYVTVYADGSPRPDTSNLNFAPGETVPNLVVVPVGSDGKVDIYNAAPGSVQVIADVAGWFASGSPAAGGLAAVSPARLLDTRSGVGASGPVPTGSAVVLQVDGRGGVPASGVGAVALNVTVTRPAAAGYVTVYADGSPRPDTSNLNFAPGETVPNLVVVPVGSDGKVDIYNEAPGSVQVIADVAGWFASS